MSDRKYSPETFVESARHTQYFIAMKGLHGAIIVIFASRFVFVFVFKSSPPEEGSTAMTRHCAVVDLALSKHYRANATC